MCACHASFMGGWVGLGLGSRQRRCPMASVTLPHRLDTVTPWLSFLTAATLPTIPEPHQGTSAREISRCLCACRTHPRGCRGFRAQGTTTHLSSPSGSGPPVGGGGGGARCFKPSIRARERDTTDFGWVCGSGDLRLPVAHD